MIRYDDGIYIEQLKNSYAFPWLPSFADLHCDEQNLVQVDDRVGVSIYTVPRHQSAPATWRSVFFDVLLAASTFLIMV